MQLLSPKTSSRTPSRDQHSARGHRRAFLVAGVAAGIGLVALPFLPWASKPDAKQLLDPAIAKADPQLIRQLCLLYYQHPQVPIRLACVSHMMRFSDQEARNALWDRARNDTDASVKARALQAIVTIGDNADTQALVQLAKSDAAAQTTIAGAAIMLGNKPLLNALKK